MTDSPSDICAFCGFRRDFRHGADMHTFMPRVPFYGDWDPEVTYPAVRYDEDWNGWAAPVVTLETLERLIGDSSPTYALLLPQMTHGEPLPGGVISVLKMAELELPFLSAAVFETYCPLPRDRDGNFHLRDLGWTFSRCDEDSDEQGNLEPDDIPDDFPVRPLSADQHPTGRTTCGSCGLSWDDDIVTGMTPVPSGRCPFEHFHN